MDQAQVESGATELSSYPDISQPRARAFSGEVRQDFHAICNSTTPNSIKLDLMCKQAGVTLTLKEEAVAMAVLGNPATPTHNVYSIILHFQVWRELETFARQVQEAFTFKDKHTRRWGMVYALVGTEGSGARIGETGFSEQTLDELLTRLRKSASSRHATNIGHFLAHVEATSASCYLWPLESHAGDLDDMSIIKNVWKLAGLRDGVRFLNHPYRMTATYSDFIAQHQWPVLEGEDVESLRVR